MAASKVERSIWINASLERAWQAVTQPEQLNRWYATYYHWEIPDLEIDAPVRFYNKQNDADYLIATIEVLNPPREFTLHWQPDPVYPAMTLRTSFLLTPENGGTRVTLLETGYEVLSIKEREQWIQAAGSGYALSVENLKALLEGVPLPY